MATESKVITLSSNYGFVIYLTEAGLANNQGIRHRSRVLSDKDNNPKLFQNARMAFLYAGIAVGLNKGEFKLKCVKFDNKRNKILQIANFEDMHLLNENVYQVITNKMIYYIREEYIDKVQSIRYFIFEHGDTERTSKEYGRKRNKQLLSMIIKAATTYFYKSGELSGVKKVSPDEIEISYKNSTAKIHIMTNGLISSINKNRKETGETSQFSRCIPFDSSLDKYVTIFSYVTKEAAEPDGFGFDGFIDECIEDTYKFIEDYIKVVEFDEPKLAFRYMPIEFNGTILSKE